MKKEKAFNISHHNCSSIKLHKEQNVQACDATTVRFLFPAGYQKIKTPNTLRLRGYRYIMNRCCDYAAAFVFTTASYVVSPSSATSIVAVVEKPFFETAHCSTHRLLQAGIM